MPRDPASGGPNDRERLQHMMDAARDVLSFCAGRARADLETDRMLLRALLHALQVIGEAAARVSDEGRARAPDLPWGKIVATRHILVHVYWGVDHEQIWKMATESVPELVAALDDSFRTWPPPDVP